MIWIFMKWGSTKFGSPNYQCAESTYSANWNIGTLPTGVTAYGGFAGSVATVGDDHRPNLDPEVQDSNLPNKLIQPTMASEDPSS